MDIQLEFPEADQNIELVFPADVQELDVGETITFEQIVGKLPLERTTGNLPTDRLEGNISADKIEGNIPLSQTSGNLPFSRTEGDLAVNRLEDIDGMMNEQDAHNLWNNT